MRIKPIFQSRERPCAQRKVATWLFGFRSNLKLKLGNFYVVGITKHLSGKSGLFFQRGWYAFSPKKRAPRNAKNKRGKGIDYPFEIGDEYEVEIEDMTPRGDGIAKIKGFPIFICNAKLNEHLKIKITHLESGCADAQIVTEPPQ